MQKKKQEWRQKNNELPQQICDRVPNTFYRYENKTRFWNGKKLQCEHKKAGYGCPTCNPEGWKKMQKRVNEWRQNNKEQMQKKKQEWRQKNKERIQKRKQEWYNKNKERMQKRMQEHYQKNKERMQEWRRTSEKNRCNDLCIDILHSQTDRSFRYKNKFGCDDGSVRVCYGCAIADIRSTEDPELKQEKKDYYNIHTTKTRYLFRIEYAILCHLNDYPLIDQMNQEVLNIHDKDIVSIVGKTTTIEKRPDRAYLMNNNLLFFEIDETGVFHEKGIERLIHLRNRLQTTFEDDRPINLHVFRFNTNEYEETSMVERREFPSGVEQKEVGYVLSEHGCNVIEKDFIPLFQNVFQDCMEMVDIENDKNLMIYELNVDDMDEMIESYVDQNENIAVSDYFIML